MNANGLAEPCQVNSSENSQDCNWTRFYLDSPRQAIAPEQLEAETAYRQAYARAAAEASDPEFDFDQIELADEAREAAREAAVVLVTVAEWKGRTPADDDERDQVAYRVGHEVEAARARGRAQAFADLERCWWSYTIAQATLDKWAAQVARWAAESIDPKRVEQPPRLADSIAAQRKAMMEGKKFPPHLLDVPGFIGQVARYTNENGHKVQPILNLAGAISLQATLAGRKVKDTQGARTNLYLICLSPSTTGKERPQKTNRDILQAIDREAAEEMASDAALATQLQSDPATLMQVDEIGRYLRGIDEKMSPHMYQTITQIVKLYGRAGSVWTGKKHADPDFDKKVAQPCLNILGFSVLENFTKAMKPENITDGLVGRLILFEGDPDPRVQKGNDDAPIPAEIIERAKWWHDKSAGVIGAPIPSPDIVSRDADAENIFEDFEKACNREVRAAGDNEMIRAPWGRVVQKAKQLALVYACSEQPEDPLITRRAAEWGCDLAEFSTRRMLSLAASYVSENQVEELSKRLYRMIEGAGPAGLAMNELTRRSQWVKAKERNAALADLHEAGQILYADVTTGKTVKRVILAVTTSRN